MRIVSSAVLVLILAGGCGGDPAPPDSSQTAGAAGVFMERLARYCGQAFEGRVVANDPADPNDPFAGQRLVMHVRECDDGEIKVPFHVGANRSRTWILTRVNDGLCLKHDHRHEDGTDDVLTMYGGDTVEAGTAGRQQFPVDQFSKDLFEREGRQVSMTNVWAMEIEPGETFVYELARPGRLFRVAFDLTTPVDPPPAPWGS